MPNVVKLSMVITNYFIYMNYQCSFKLYIANQNTVDWFFQVKIISITKYLSKNIFGITLKWKYFICNSTNVETTYSIIAVNLIEDSEEATHRCSVRWYISHLLCYMEYSCGRNTPVWTGELDNFKDRYAVGIGW